MPERSRRHAEIAAKLAQTYPAVAPEHIGRMAARRVREEFLTDLSRLASERAGVSQEEIEELTAEETGARGVALAEICSELSLLDEALVRAAKLQEELDREPLVDIVRITPDKSAEQHVFKGRRPPMERTL